MTAGHGIRLQKTGGSGSPPLTILLKVPIRTIRESRGYPLAGPSARSLHHILCLLAAPAVVFIFFTHFILADQFLRAQSTNTS
jgi:hypothetical protein